MLKQPKLRIMINIGIHGATDKYCGGCIFVREGNCHIFGVELDWDKTNLQFKRCDECEFNTIQERRKR